METKSVVVCARLTPVEGMFEYQDFYWTVDEKGIGTFPGLVEFQSEQRVYRTIHVDVRDDLSFRVSNDTVTDYRFDDWMSGTYESPEIASDDVAQDMMEVAIANCWPEAYEAKCRREDEQARQDEINRESAKARAYYYGC
jgi:hypothetical protein